MNYTFSDPLRRVLALARDEALRLHHDFVGVQHITLALLAAQDTRACEAVRALGLDPLELRVAVVSVVDEGDSPTLRGELPYSRGGKATLERAVREAREEDRWDVHTGDLLLGVLHLHEHAVSAVLLSAGLTTDRVLDALASVDRSLG